MFIELQRPAGAMLRRAFRGAFSSHELDDIYAGAWVSVLRALAPRHQELSDDEVRSYVLTAVAHQAGKELRRRRRKPTAPLELVGSVPDGADGPAERADGAEQSRVTRDLLASLPPRRRAVMLLRYGWGLEPRQVCGLVPGLSPRAYRKEITRGIDELIEKMRAFERGDWCADREQVLKAYAAGLADADEQRQAKAHLSHCRECSGFVRRLSGHLYGFGTLAVPVSISALGAPGPVADRLTDLGDRVRDVVNSSPLNGGAAQEAAGPAAATAGVRGGGAAGAGLLTKLAALGAGGKLALACVGGGVATTACIAAGVVSLGGPKIGAAPVSDSRPERSQAHATAAVATPSPVVAEIAAPATGAGPGGVTAEPEPRSPSADPAPPQPDDAVVAEAPAEVQEFGLETAATPPPRSDAGVAPAASSADGDANDAAVTQEFGGP